MNKNPFTPAQTYTPQQPPLPPGPPPAQPAQPADYSHYWAAAAAAAQHPQPPTVGATYGGQWTAQQAAQPQQAAANLYANYGYGQGYNWQQQQQARQQQAQAYAQPPAPVSQPPPAPPPQPAYNPYQPQAGVYQQPYIPQGAPPQPTPFSAPVPQPQQAYFSQQHPPRPNIHHTSPQHPPAKRQRFDGPNQRAPIPQPQFQAPPPPPMQQGGFIQGGGRGRGGGGLGNQQMNRGGGPGGGGRGGGSFRGKSNFTNNNRGGSSNMRGGRGGGNMYGNSGGRGGGGGGGQPLQKQHSNRGFYGNKDYHNNRRGGSFNSGHSHHYQQQPHNVSSSSSSFRGGRGSGQGHYYTPHSRAGGGGGGGGGRHECGQREGTMVSSSFSGPSPAKKEENRRTLTDFKIVGLEIKELAWSWGSVPSSASASASASASIKAEPKGNGETLEAAETNQSSPVKPEGDGDDADAADPVAKSESTDAAPPATAANVESVIAPGTSDAASALAPASAPLENKPTAELLAASAAASPLIPLPPVTLDPPPPSRLRIYFHTPVSADDSHPISVSPHASFSLGGASTPASASDLRKGKRKKLEDDDGDLEEGRAPPPPPGLQQHNELGSSEHDAMSMDGFGRGSMAPSVAETTSEGDWLMAAIGGEDEGGEGEPQQRHEGDESAEQIWPHDGDGNNEYDYEGGQNDEHHNGPHEQYEDDHEHAVFVGVAGPYHDAPNGGASPEHSQIGSANGSHFAGHPPLAGPVSPDKTNEGENNLAQTQTESSASADVSMSAPPQEQSAAAAAATATGSTNGSSVPPLGEQPTDVSAPQAPVVLQSASSLASVGEDSQSQEPHFSAVAGDAGSVTYEEQTQTQPLTQTESQSQLPFEYGVEPNRSQSQLSAFGEALRADVAGKTPSANRLSISYAAGSRRLVIDAEIVDKLKVFRKEGRIEVVMNLSKDETNGLRGVLIEGLSDTTKSYLPLPAPLDALDSDPTMPPFSKAPVPLNATMIIYLDTEKPLSEAKWVKTGDVQEWLKSMFGRMFWVAGDAASGWEKRIEVVDPDPAPTIWSILEGWAVNSTVGQQVERQRFYRTHMTETDNILEILLRLVRGERATPFSQGSSSISIQSVSGPLLSALSPGSAHGAQQTHVSLAVLAIFRMAVEYAKKAVGDKGKGEAEERVGEIIRCLPSHLLYKSLDGIFKEWKVEKKGGR